jgi:hypothetical protein
MVMFTIPISKLWAGNSDKGKYMFSDDLGFNPFDKNNSNAGKKHVNSWTRLRDKFLDSFNQNHIFAYNGNPRKKISSMNHTNDLIEALEANVKNHSDVYFYVNGGRKLYAIKQFTCCFCDMDAGRDNEGKYFKPSIVMTKKKHFLKKINEFPVKPSWVVDTRNGYQCYWIFDGVSRNIVQHNKTFWNGLQKKLVNYFDGDPRAIKPNQIYRVPYTWWRKEWEKKAPYFTSILPGSTGQPINVADLKSALTGQPATLQIIPEKCSDEWYKGYAKAYKQSDITGVPVSASVAADILNSLQNTQTEGLSEETICGKTVYGYANQNSQNYKKYGTEMFNRIEKSYGIGHPQSYSDPMPVVPTDEDNDALVEHEIPAGDEDLSLDGSQTKLLKTVVEFLNQVSTPLYFSGNKFLSGAAKELANELSDKFCIG